MSTSLAPPVSTENDPHDSMPSYGAALSWADKVLADIKRDVEAPKEAAEAHGLGPSAPDLSASEKPDSPTLHVKPSELMARDPASLDFGWHRDDFVAAKPEASPKAPATDTPSQNWPPRLDWPPPVDIAPGSASNFKIEPIVEKRPKSRWMGRTAVGFLFALVSAMAAASWPHYGGKIKQSLAEWTPPAMISSLGKINAAGRSAPSPSPTMVGSAAAAAPADQAEQPSSASQGAASAQPASSSSPAVESASSVQSLKGEIAAMGQTIEQLKATIADLKAGQDQMARDLAKAYEARATDAAAAPTPRARPVPAHVASPKPAQPKPAPSARMVPPRPVGSPQPLYSSSRPLTPANAQASAYPPPAPRAAPSPYPAAETRYVPPPPPPSSTVTEADDEGPVIRPPMPLQ